MTRGTKASISGQALRHNFKVIQSLAPNSKVWAVVKANGYGHGAVCVAKILSQADGFAVSTLEEGLSLRRSGIKAAILLLEGVTNSSHLLQANDFDFECVVHSVEQIEHFRHCVLTRPVKVWLKVDTGMHRLGFSAEDLNAARVQLQALKNVEIVGVMTHLACADDLENPAITERQLEIFKQCVESGDQVSISNSAAIISWSDSHRDWVRPGIMLYGATPFSTKTAQQLGLKAVMSLNAPVIALHQVNAGQSIGYGHQWCAQRDSIIATLAIGYGDGYPRHAPNGTPVWINAQRAMVVGRISMDMTMIDVTDLAEVVVGDLVELWGENLPVDEVARWVGSIGYELLTRISPRVALEVIE